MKEGKSLVDLAKELDRQATAKRDFIVDTRTVQVIPAEDVQAQNAKRLEMLIPIESAPERFPINNFALRQIGERLKIPAKFVDRLAEKYPDMLAYNINGLFSREPEKRMIRTLDGNARAFLSDRYRPMDNYDLANAVIPVLSKHGAQVTSCDVTETKMYIKAIKPEMTQELGPPQGAVMGQGHNFFIEKVTAGICISNSEIGSGRLFVQPASFTERCTNYAVFESSSFGKYHLGRSQGSDFDSKVWEVLTDETKQISDQALYSQVKDLAEASMDGTIFAKIIDSLKAARGEEIKGNIPQVIEVVQKQFNLSQDEGGGIMSELIKGGDLTKYGLHAAVTRYSQEVESYDRATELENLGGKIIELPKTSWETIAKAA